jgi:hypothetical protein
MSFSSERPPLLVRLRFALLRSGRRLADAGATIIAPFERLLARVTHRIFAATESFEGIDSVLIAIAWALTWPVRFLWRLLTSAAGLLPESVQNVLTAPFRFAQFIWRLIIVSFMRSISTASFGGW